jgi:hypothetical protein
MNNKKLIGILIVIIGFIALVGFIYFVFFYTPSPNSLSNEEREHQPQPALNQIQEQPAPTSPQRAVINVAEQKPRSNIEVTESDLKRLAASFAERFGSYSNQSNYGNIRDLKIFMTKKMKKWADDFIQKEMAQNKDSAIYYGISTKAVASEVKKFDNDLGQAEILVSTQRREAISSPSNMTSFRQDITINFLKEGGIWKVDSAYWKSRQ